MYSIRTGASGRAGQRLTRSLQMCFPKRSVGRAPAAGLLVGLVTLGLAHVVSAQSLEDEQGPLPTLEITPGRLEEYRAAVLRFREVGPTVGEKRSAELRKQIEAGLAFSGVVIPLDRAAFLGPDESIPLDLKLGFDCDTWKQSGADALVQGELRRDGPRLRADVQVWDIARCKVLKTGTLRGDREKPGKLGKLIADQVVEALTGTAGVASTELAFISDRTGSREVYVMAADGSDQRRATHGRGIKMFPDWMPDGRALLYIAYDGLLPGFFLTSRSDSIRPGPILRSVLPRAPKYRGRFDPSGEELAMVASADGAAEIFRVRRKTKEFKRLTRNPAIDIAPSWSPDGSQIVFVSDRSGAPQLYIMNRDGSGTRRLTYTGAYNSAPAWSPDGRWIVYETRVRGQFDLWLIDPQGEVTFPIVEHPLGDEAPTWSPDGRKIAFASRRRGRFDIYTIDWNGGNLARLTERMGANVHPDWSPRIAE